MLSSLFHNFQEDSHYYYHPTEYRPTLRPLPEERRGLGETQLFVWENNGKHIYHLTMHSSLFMFCPGVHHVAHLPVNPDSHVYEDVTEAGVYRDTVAPALPFPNHELTQQRSDWRSMTYRQVC